MILNTESSVFDVTSVAYAAALFFCDTYTYRSTSGSGSLPVIAGIAPPDISAAHWRLWCGSSDNEQRRRQMLLIRDVRFIATRSPWYLRVGVQKSVSALRLLALDRRETNPANHGPKRQHVGRSTDISQWCHAWNRGGALSDAASPSTRRKTSLACSYGERFESLDAIMCTLTRTPPRWRRESLVNLEGARPAADTGWPVKSEHAQVGLLERSRNMWLWHYRRTMQHPLPCPMMDTAWQRL